jgi:hypothetical protein
MRTDRGIIAYRTPGTAAPVSGKHLSQRAETHYTENGIGHGENRRMTSLQVLVLGPLAEIANRLAPQFTLKVAIGEESTLIIGF